MEGGPRGCQEAASSDKSLMGVLEAHCLTVRLGKMKAPDQWLRTMNWGQFGLQK